MPPGAAVELARAVVATGFGGVYVDANAIAPSTVAAIDGIVTERGGQLVDGGLVGPPAERPGTTRLYLSGARAETVAGLFAAGPLEARVIGDEPGAASALKMCYAAYTKGTAALLLAVVALAEATGVAAALSVEWERSQRDLPDRVAATARGSAPKAWRWVGEMEEIASTFADAGLPDGFHRAAADVFGRLAELKDADAVTADDVTALLLGDGPPGGLGPAGTGSGRPTRRPRLDDEPAGVPHQELQREHAAQGRLGLGQRGALQPHGAVVVGNRRGPLAAHAADRRLPLGAFQLLQGPGLIGHRSTPRHPGDRRPPSALNKYDSSRILPAMGTENPRRTGFRP